MRRILSSAFAAVAMLAMTVSASASFVVDDYTDDSLGTQQVFSQAGFTIDRTFTGVNWQPTSNPAAVFQLTDADDGVHSITYNVTGGTFGDIFDALVSANPVSGVEGVSFAYLLSGSYALQVTNDSGFDSGLDPLFNSNSPLLFEDASFDTATEVTLTFTGGDFPGSTLFTGFASSAFVATPEPTSLLLFGSVLGAVALRRRKG